MSTATEATRASGHRFADAKTLCGNIANFRSNL
jgi:hypothetical protein